MFELCNSTVADLAWPLLPNPVTLERLAPLHLEKIPWGNVYDVLTPSLILSLLFKILFLILIAANFKNFPFVYHLRILNAVRFVLRSQRSEQDIKPEQLFQPLITSSKACLMEIDVYGHKSNSTYFSDVDIARAHLVTTLFSKGIEKMRGSTTMNGLSSKGTSKFTMALGAVSCTFRKELKPYETYDMWTRILAWDQKWIYIVTHFVKKGAKITPCEFTLYPQQRSLGSAANSRNGSVASIPSTPRGSVSGPTGNRPDSGIAASALSKIVFKDGRMTIAPQIMLEAAGLLPPRPDESVAEYHDELTAAQVAANLDADKPQKAAQTVDKLEGSDNDSDGDSATPRRSSTEDAIVRWAWDRIETERQRGMKMASLLAKQTALEEEFNDEVALCRHYDGYGVEGVVSTLAQLGGLSRYQLL